MHIALLTDGITPYVTGGMQRHSYHLARHLLGLGVQLTLVHCVYNGQHLPDEDEVALALGAEPGKLRVLGFHFPKGNRLPGHYLRQSYRYSCNVYEALKEEWIKFDFVYAKGYTAWCLLEHRKSGEHTAPVGVKFHGYEMFQKTGDLKEKLIQFMLRPPVVFMCRNAQAVFSYGGDITEIISQMGVERSRIVEIPSGIDDAWIAAAPLPQIGPRRLLFIGRNERRKGIDELLRCADLIERGGAELHWIGPLPEAKRLQVQNSHYHGEVTDPEKLRALIDQCQVLVAPSHSEGMPNVILEAMARGLAVIATDVGAVSKLVAEDNGKLIAPLSNKQLRAALTEMMHLPSPALDIMRMRSIEKVRNGFRWSNIAQQTLASIARITHKK